MTYAMHLGDGILNNYVRPYFSYITILCNSEVHKIRTNDLIWSNFLTQIFYLLQRHCFILVLCTTCKLGLYIKITVCS